MTIKKIDLYLKEGLKIRTAVDIVIFNQEGQVLLGKRKAKAGFDSWGFPGGHLKTGEKIRECAQREIREELDKDIKIKITNEVLAVRENCLPPYFIHHLTMMIKGYYIKGEIKVNEPERCEKWSWFSLENLPSPLFSGVKEILLNYKTSKVSVITDWQKP